MLKQRNVVLTATFLAFVFAGSSFCFAGERSAKSPQLQRRGAVQSNAYLSKKVRHQLLMLPYYTVFDNLEYRVNGEHVELYGQVVNPVLKSDAGAAVKRIEGVEKVTNRIEVLPVSFFDNRIRFAMLHAIYGEPALARYALGANPPIHIIVKNGNVRLVGIVDSKMDSELVYMRARGVPGVFSVTNDLRVEKS